MDVSLPIEIERKFSVKHLPDGLENYPQHHIVQGYISIGNDGKEIRLRNKDNDYFLTVKSGGGLVRSEYEIKLTQEQFQDLWPATDGKRLEKTRYFIPGNIELDIYSGDLEGLITAEVEFKSEKDSEEFTPPDWFDEELTYDKKYKNQSLAVEGSPALS